jgi:response regulator RpfG family c-di-GMP phosphodiesterase
VDDEPDVSDSIRDLLRREFTVLRATTADEGYRLLAENEVHIIMTDQRMPQMTGVELLAKVRVRHPQAIRLLFTGYADLDSIIAAINQGHIFQFLKKPWQPEELQAAVRQAAAEYDRLVEKAEENARLRAALEDVRRRLSVLEADVVQMRESLKG